MKKKRHFWVLIISINYLISGCLLSREITPENYNISKLKNLNPQVIELKKFPLITQINDSSCGIASLAMIISYLSNPISQENIFQRFEHDEDQAITIKQFKQYLDALLPAFTTEYRANLTSLNMLKTIHEQLKKGMPTPIFYACPNKGDLTHYVLHVSIVYGIDLAENKIYIANPFGYKEKIDIYSFLNQMAFTVQCKLEFIEKTIINLKRIDKNMFFLINK